jgi:hypothetical protein
MQATLKMWASGAHGLRNFLTAETAEEAFTYVSLTRLDTKMEEFGYIALGEVNVMMEKPLNRADLIAKGIIAIDAALGKAHTDANALKQTLLAIGYEEK